MTRGLAQLAADALACLQRECPAAHVAVQTAIGDRRVRLAIDREEFDLAGGAIAASADEPAILLRSDTATVCAVLYGELDIVDALVDERVHVRGGTRDVIAGANAMTAFLAGALRCDSMPALLQRLAIIARGDSI